MGGKPAKTNAMRLLDGQRIPYVVHSYSTEVRSAEEVAAAVGFPASQVFKTLVALPEEARTPAGKRRMYLAIVPGDSELDLKSLAQATDDKRLRMATHREAEALTGLQVGGISALALMNRGFTVYLDESASQYEEILVSAGQRGINLQLRVADLVRLTGARLASIVRAPAEV